MKIKELLTKTGRVNSGMVKEKNFKSNYEEEYALVIGHAKSINISDRQFTEKLYHFLVRSNSGISCLKCELKVPKFFGIKKGYADFCSSKCSNGSESVQNKKKNAYLEKYGVDNPSKDKGIIKKIENTFIKNYGANPFTLDHIKNKIKKTCLEKYGTEFPLSGDSPVRKRILENKEEDFKKKYKHLDITYYNPKKWGECRIICFNCNNEFEISKWNLHQRWQAKTDECTICNPIGSDTETSIEAFIKTILKDLNVSYIEKSRKIISDGREIDIFINDLKIGIEINGIFWHSDIYKSVDYHKTKTDLCLKENIKLIQIMEDEIHNSPEVVKSRIKSLLKKSEKTIWARKCEIKHVNSKISNEFLEENHIQGKCGSSYSIGLYYDEKLVSLMTFGKLRKSLGSQSTESIWELIRFCNVINTQVVGGASKLIKHFITEKNPIKIISYCDRRWSPTGDLYSKLGFKFIHNTRPNYWYYKNNSYQKFHRFNFRKDVLVKEGYNASKTEFEIMNERKFIRVYDCGSSKWEFVPNKKGIT